MFAVSTVLYRQRRLTREHLDEIAAFGFRGVELCASRFHLDYHNDTTLTHLEQWIADAGLTLTSVHAPVLDVSLASAVAAEREHALAETARALEIAHRMPFPVLVVHLGRPRHDGARGGTNRDAEIGRAHV